MSDSLSHPSSRRRQTDARSLQEAGSWAAFDALATLVAVVRQDATLLFVNAALGDFHPAAQSACINTGIMDATWMDMAEDLAGKARVMGPAVDMGAPGGGGGAATSAEAVDLADSTIPGIRVF